MAWLSLEVTPATRRSLQALSKALGKPQLHIIENLRVLVSCVWDHVGVLGQIMLYTHENKDAWREENLLTIGETLAMVADLANGIEGMRFAFHNPETVKAERATS